MCATLCNPVQPPCTSITQVETGLSAAVQRVQPYRYLLHAYTHNATPAYPCTRRTPAHTYGCMPIISVQPPCTPLHTLAQVAGEVRKIEDLGL